MRHVVWTGFIVVAACSGGQKGGNGGHEPGLGPAELTPEAPMAPCEGVPVYTFDQLAAGEAVGERIAVDGVPIAEVFCTLLACDTECCNGCGGQYVLSSGEPARIDLRGLAGCDGMDCNLHCEPFGRSPTQRYRFVGVNTPVEQTAVYHKVEIAVEAFCAL
jgi:hypothetical protein